LALALHPGHLSHYPPWQKKINCQSGTLRRVTQVAEIIGQSRLSQSPQASNLPCDRNAIRLWTRQLEIVIIPSIKERCSIGE